MRTPRLRVLALGVVPVGMAKANFGDDACGKSTLLRSMSRLPAPRAGRVVLDGKEVHRTPAKELARTLGLLPQSPVTPEGITVLDLLTDLNRTRGTTIVMVLHDLNLAARYADRLIAPAAGGLHAAGNTEEVMTEDTVRSVYGMESRVIEDPVSGRPLVLPVGRHHTTPTTPTATVAGDNEARP
ncbi:ABC transporter ATP-binding protein [Streptomyces coelicoflavus]|uniref:ABC transporter ATP-binding protein n=1 Tax=Streptomyces coelicoflavus TaxID=285562 RepID=UPI003D9E0C0B